MKQYMQMPITGKKVISIITKDIDDLDVMDTVRIKKTGETGFISCQIDENRFAVNTGYADNQPICHKDELERI